MKIFLISMAAAITLSGCSSSRLLIVDGGREYERKILKFCGLTLSDSRTPVPTRKEKVEARNDEIADNGVIAIVVGVFMATAGFAFHALYKNPIIQRISAAVAVLGGSAVVGGIVLMKLAEWRIFVGIGILAAIAWAVLHFLRDKGFGRNEKDPDSRAQA